MAKVVWTKQSRDDLNAVKAYIARDAPRTAELFVHRLIKSVERLRRMPLAGSVVVEFGQADVREILHGNYRNYLPNEAQRGRNHHCLPWRPPVR